MIETVDPSDCGSYSLHSEHTWRTGFLWLNKNVCRGSAFPDCRFDRHEDFEPPRAALVPIANHKHFYRLTEELPMGLKRPTDILWKCDGCRHFFISDRDVWHSHPVGVTYDIK